ncbi:MAG: AmpG family muropeptide MFS transporter [Candidatus Aminicenantes bacterium]|nr:AmpG family muropeptide MFS transporter [Candidatus Aminicenantes bacterium]
MKNKTSLLKEIAKKRMMIALLMGFSSGVPLLLTSKTLQAWMVDVHVDLKIIGIFALVGLPYTLKFLWAPLMDMWAPPFLGRRRGWMLLCQVGVIVSIIGISFSNHKETPWVTALFALLISFFSASQDIVVDAYRRETLSDNELGMGSTLYIYGYRVAMLLTGALALFLADHISWFLVYLLMAASMFVGIATTLFSPEPDVGVEPPKTLRESVVLPFREFFKRKGAIAILLFILLYKMGDNIAGAMTMPFYLIIGFTKTEVAAIAKALGLISTLAGAFVGGVVILRLGIYRSLWIFGIMQALSTAFFAILAQTGPENWVLALVIGYEDFSSGMGSAALIAYSASLCNKRFTATQYALLSSLAGVPRALFATTTGFIAEALGWTWFFIFSALLAIPGLLLLLYLKPQDREVPQIES